MIEDITFSENYIEVQDKEFYFKAYIKKHNYDPDNYDIIDIQIHSQALDIWLSTDHEKAYSYAHELLEKALIQTKQEIENDKENVREAY